MNNQAKKSNTICIITNLEHKKCWNRHLKLNTHARHVSRSFGGVHRSETKPRQAPINELRKWEIFYLGRGVRRRGPRVVKRKQYFLMQSPFAPIIRWASRASSVCVRLHVPVLFLIFRGVTCLLSLRVFWN